MKIYNVILLVIFLISGAKNAFSQCAQLTKDIKKAERFYDDGNLKGAVDLLERSVSNSNGCDDEIKRAKILLTRVYLFMNNDTAAESSYKKVLDIDPMYKPDPTLEPIDVIYFSEQFQTIPRWSVTPELIFGQPYVYVENIYNITMSNESFGQNEGDNSAYRQIFGYGGGVRGSFYLNKWLEISGGIQYQSRAYQIEKNIKGVKFANDADGNRYLPPDSLSIIEDIVAEEHQHWINIPIQLRFNFGTKDLMPTLYLGAEYGWIFEAEFTEARKGGYTADLINVNGLRNSQQLGWTLGAALNYRPSKSTKNFLTINAQYTRYTTMLNNAENRFNNTTLLYVLGYLDDDFSLGYFQVSLGFTIANYRVIKNRRR